MVHFLLQDDRRATVTVPAPRGPSSRVGPIRPGRVTRRAAADLEIVIPAYNEAARLPDTLARTAEFLAARPWRSQVVVVDNGSIDDTAAVVREFAGASPVPVHLIGCSRPGKGAAVRRGLLSSGSRFVGFFDADLATPLETLEVTMRLLRHGATAVIASRHLPESSFVRRQGIGRRVGGSVFRLLTQSMVDGVRDTQCGFKFFERDAVARAMVQCRTGGFAFDAELLRRLQRDGGRIVEVPVAWTDGAASSLRPIRDGAAAFGAVLKVYGV